MVTDMEKRIRAAEEAGVYDEYPSSGNLACGCGYNGAPYVIRHGEWEASPRDDTEFICPHCEA